jgi:hypothetical protein
MTWIQLKEPPKDLVGYIGAPYFDTPEKTESNLRGLIREGKSNIKAISFDVGIIQNLEKDIIENKYIVQFVPTSVEAFADFYLVTYRILKQTQSDVYITT